MEKKKFNKDWIFYSENKQYKTTLPHDAMILNERDENSINTTNTGYFRGQDCFYIKRFYAEKDWKNIILEFDGVYKDAVVSVNGKKIYNCHYGYSNFLVDISSVLYKDNDNEIRVDVHNSDAQNSRWYSGTGIYRDIFLHTAGELAICPDGVRINVTDIEKELAVLNVITMAKYTGKKDRYVWVVTKIYDPDGMLLTTARQPAHLDANNSDNANEMVIRQRVYVQMPFLWDTEHPNLYRCETVIMCESEIMDVHEEKFGIRKLQLDPCNGFRLNGKIVKLRGGCIHHDNGVIGAIDTKDTALFRVKRLKKAGFNALRIAHHPASKVILDACDELGMLVMDESFDMWHFPKTDYDNHQYFRENWEEIIESMVRKNYNHPSVIFYSIGNEIQEIGTKLGGQTSRKLAEKIRALDTGRFVTNAINGMMTVMDDMDSIIPLVFSEEEIAEKQIKRPVTDINYALTLFLDRTEKINMLDKVTDMLAESSEVLDVVGYNYATGRYILDQKNNPDRILVGSETFPSEIARNWKLVESIPQLIGDFTWTAWDYLGETGIGVTTYNMAPSFSQEYPYYIAYCGDIDITGYRRPASYYREIVWGLREKPYIGVWDPKHSADTPFWTPWSLGPAVASWTWPGCEGIQTRIEVYADGDEVELYLNSRSLGRKKLGETLGYRAEYDVEYKPGELKAVSYRKGKTIAEYTLVTAGFPRKLVVIPDKSVVAADGEALIFVDIFVTDEQGVVNMSCNEVISVEIIGGTLLGLGNADPKDSANFFDTSCELYEGHAFAVLRSGTTAGMLKVQVISKVLDDACLTIEMR